MATQPRKLSFLGAEVFFHGESYVTGDLDTHDWLCSALASLSRSSVVSVAYRQPPEVRFPAPVNDAHAAVDWVAGGRGETFRAA